MASAKSKLKAKARKFVASQHPRYPKGYTGPPGKGGQFMPKDKEALKRVAAKIKSAKSSSGKIDDAAMSSLKARIAQLEADAAKAQQIRPGMVRDEAVGDLNLDPKRFQYKLSPGETGSTGSLTGVKRWDPNLAGVVQVWQDPADGKTYIVNGHNRANLAKRLGAEKVTVRYLDAKDASEARAIGAITNIAEGRGNPLDSAKFFRDTGLTRQDLEDRGIPMQEKIASDGLALSQLDDSLFRRVIDGRLTVNRGVIIGNSGLDSTDQRALSDMVESKEKRGKVSNETISELVDIVKASSKSSSFTMDLFGGSETEVTNAFERAQIQSTIKKKLSREKKLFSTVGKSKAASELQKAGNQIDVATSQSFAQDASMALGVFDKMKNISGPVSKSINDATAKISAGANRAQVEAQLYDEILELIKAGKY